MEKSLLNKNRLLRNKQEIIFWAISIVVFAFIIIYSIYSISFLTNKAKSVFGDGLIKPSEIVKFNLEKVEALKR